MGDPGCRSVCHPRSGRGDHEADLIGAALGRVRGDTAFEGGELSLHAVTGAAIGMHIEVTFPLVAIRRP